MSRVALAALVGGALFVGSCSLPNVGLFDRGQVGDTPQYRPHGDAVLGGELPYRDFYLEYPPGALVPFTAAEPGPGGGYATRFKLLAVAFGLGTIGFVAWTLALLGASRRRMVAACAFAGIAPALLGPVVIVNYDLWPAFLTSAALAAVLARRERLGGGLLAAATVAKLYAVVLLPLLVLRTRARRGVVVAFAAVAAAALLPFFVAAPRGMAYDLSITARRPLQIESLGASILLAAHRLGLYDAHVNSVANSQNLGGTAPKLLGALIAVAAVAALAVVYVAFARGERGDERFVLGAAAAIAGLVAFGKVLSPQYLVWLVPLVVLVRTRAAWTLLAAALVLTQAWFPRRYGEVVALGPEVWLVLVRNLVLVALFGVLLVSLRRAAEP